MHIDYLKSIAVIHVDMDGTIAKWNENATAKQLHSKGYFANLESTPLLPVIKRLLDAGFDVRIRSSIYDDVAACDKRKWLNDHGLQGIPHVFIPYGTPKSSTLPQDGKIHILIDDHSPNLFDWVQNVKNGVAIKYRNHINCKNGTWRGWRLDERMSEVQSYMYLLCVMDTISKIKKDAIG